MKLSVLSRDNVTVLVRLSFENGLTTIEKMMPALAPFFERVIANGARRILPNGKVLRTLSSSPMFLYEVQGLLEASTGFIIKVESLLDIDTSPEFGKMLDDALKATEERAKLHEEDIVAAMADFVVQADKKQLLSTAPLKKGDTFLFKDEPDDRVRVVDGVEDGIVRYTIHTPYGDEPEEGWAYEDSLSADKINRLPPIDVDKMMADLRAHYGDKKVDDLLDAAAAALSGPRHELTEAEWEAEMAAFVDYESKQKE